MNKAGYKLWIKELDGFTVVGTSCGQVGGYAQGEEQAVDNANNTV